MENGKCMKSGWKMAALNSTHSIQLTWQHFVSSTIPGKGINITCRHSGIYINDLWVRIKKWTGPRHSLGSAWDD